MFVVPVDSKFCDSTMLCLFKLFFQKSFQFIEQFTLGMECVEKTILFTAALGFGTDIPFKFIIAYNYLIFLSKGFDL